VITYAERVCFREAHMQMLTHTAAYVARVSKSWGNELRCHELARAVREVIDDSSIVVVDGRCGPIEHSWLFVEAAVILDVYVPGRLPAVQLVDLIVGTAYRPGLERADIRQSIVDRLVVEMHGSGTS
jgi:hypothetical protein